MRKNIALVLFGVCAVVFGLVSEDPGPMRYEKIDKTKKVSFVEKGVPIGEIVHAKGKGPRYAAEELQRFIERSTGVKIPIVSRPTDGKPAFMIGIAPEGYDVAALPRDGFIIRTVADKVYIVGRDDAAHSPAENNQPPGMYYERGTLMGVYGFLEKFLDAKLLYPIPECEYVRPMESLVLPGLDIYDRPDNTMRSHSWTSGWSDRKLAQIAQARTRHQTDFIPNCHGLSRLGYIERFGKEHPEYFAMHKNGTRSNSMTEHHGGQLCYSSDIKEVIYQDAKAYLTGKSAEERGVFVKRFNKCTWDWNCAWRRYYFNVMPQDGMVPCQCEKCKAEMAKNPLWSSEVVWKMTVDIANRLKAEGIKGEVTQMAYGLLRNIPPFDIPPYIPVMVAVQGPWSERREGSFAEQGEIVSNWRKKLKHKVWLWTYPCKYGGRNIKGVPCATPRAIGHFFKQVQGDIFGAYSECDTDKASFQLLNIYVHSRMLWNSSLDPDKLVDELCRDFFGEGAKPMIEFFQMIEDLWLERICANCVMTEIGPVQTTPSQRTLWTDIYSPETLAKMQALVDAAKTAVKGNKKQLASIEYWEREYIASLSEQAGKFHSSQKSLEMMNTYVPEGTPAMTGTLEDKAWQNGALLKLRPQKHTPVEVQTEVRLLRDDKNIYIGIYCEEPRMADRHLFTLKHDDSSVWESDSIEIFLDADASRHRYAQLMLNTAGAYCDLMVDKASTKHDLSYESNAKVLYGTRDNAWTMEVAFPLESLGNARKYGFDICRSRVLKNDNSVARYYQWTPFARRYGDVENFGTISFDAIENKNLLDNASFDKPQKGRWFGKWYCEQKQFDSKQVSLDKSVFMFCGQSLRLEGKYSPNHKEWTAVGQYLEGIKPNRKYRLTAYLKIDAKEQSQKGSVFFFFNDGVNHQLPNTGGIHETIPWTAFVFDFTTRDKISSKPYLRLYNSMNGTAWLDGVILQELE